MDTAERVEAQAKSGELTVTPVRDVGSVSSHYPVEVVVAAAAATPYVMFEVAGNGANAILGYVPVVISGLETSVVSAGHGLWLRPEGADDFTLLAQGTGNEFWQTNYDRVLGHYNLIFNVEFTTTTTTVAFGSDPSAWPPPPTASPTEAPTAGPTSVPTGHPTPEAVSLVKFTSDIEIGGTVDDAALTALQSDETKEVFKKAIADAVVGVEPEDIDILCVNKRSVCYPAAQTRRRLNDDDPVVVKFEVRVVAETVAAAQAADSAEAPATESLAVEAVETLRTAIIADVGAKVADGTVMTAVKADNADLAAVTASYDTVAAETAAEEENIEQMSGGTFAPTDVPSTGSPTAAPSTGTVELIAVVGGATIGAALLIVAVRKCIMLRGKGVKAETVVPADAKSVSPVVGDNDGVPPRRD